MKDFPTEIDYYEHYSAHKGWTASPNPHIGLDRFSCTFQRLNLTDGARILEIGFGEGRFLDWAKAHGYQVEGVEILPEMVDYARTKGHVVYLGRFSTVPLEKRSFDALTAFDVIEHLSLDELVDLFRTANRVLTDDGKIIVQFPNAASPFSAPYQRGDITHRQTLSKELVDQIAGPLGWRVAESFNARPSSSNPLKKLGLFAAHLVRDMIEVVIGLAYFGCRYPLDPNIVLVLERR